MLRFERVQQLVPPLSKEAFEDLKNSISTNGLYVPIIINKTGDILDGHSRYRICRELGITPQVQVKEFDDPLLEKKFVIECNLKRRHLTDFQKAELGLLLEPIEAELAKRRLSEAGKIGAAITNEVGVSSNELTSEKGQARDKVAKKVGLSPTTYQRAKKIIEEAPEELKEKVRTGRTSIAYAYKKVKRAQDHKETESFHSLQSLEAMKKSISQLGLIHPIVVSEDLELIAGQRRIEVGSWAGQRFR